MIKRVLMTGDTVGGVWNFTLDLARALGARGVEVVLAAMGGLASPSQRAEAKRIENLRLYSTDWKLEWMNNPWDDLRAATEWLLELESHFSPDVIHLNSYGAGGAPWKTPVILTAHSCVRSWWRSVHGDEAPSEWDRYVETVRQAVRNAWIVTAPSSFMLHSMERDYGPLPRGAVIANGRDAAQFRAAHKEPFVLGAGRVWDRAKNIETLAHAAEPTGWPVYIAGSLRGPDGAVRPVDGCRSLGQLDSTQLKDWYARAAIYALPARYEPFGLSVLEAALSGCALVLGDIPSLRETWQGAAIFLPPDHVKAWRMELRKLANDAALRNRLGLLARQRGEQFTVERMADAYTACYAAALQPEEAACAS